MVGTGGWGDGGNGATWGAKVKGGGYKVQEEVRGRWKKKEGKESECLEEENQARGKWEGGAGAMGEGQGKKEPGQRQEATMCARQQRQQEVKTHPDGDRWC